jgi:hypothetical protein
LAKRKHNQLNFKFARRTKSVTWGKQRKKKLKREVRPRCPNCGGQSCFTLVWCELPGDVGDHKAENVGPRCMHGFNRNHKYFHCWSCTAVWGSKGDAGYLERDDDDGTSGNAELCGADDGSDGRGEKERLGDLERVET